jgi:hypothetical protein
VSRLRKFLALAPEDRRLLLGAAGWLMATRLGLAVLPFGWLRTLVARARPTRASHPSSPDRIAWAVAAAGRRIPGGTNCLVQAVAARVLLGRHGYSSRLRVGVARAPGGRLEAHAWVESDGRVLLGGPRVESYTPLPALEHTS